ncbi:unnamed protein product [Arctogadus glacialis]
MTTGRHTLTSDGAIVFCLDLRLYVETGVTDPKKTVRGKVCELEVAGVCRSVLEDLCLEDLCLEDLCVGDLCLEDLCLEDLCVGVRC